MSDNNDGFVPSIQAQPDAPQQKKSAVQSDSASVASPQKDSGGTSVGFVPSVHTKSTPPEETEQPSALEKTDKAITGALETNPENLKSLARTNAIEVPKTLGREVYSGAKAVAGLIPSIYHAFADEATPEEKAKYAEFEKKNKEAPETETSGLKRIGLGVGRMTGVPAAQGAYKDYASGKVGVQDVFENAPEALGQGAGTVVGGELLGKGAKAVKETAPAVIGKVADVASKVKSPDTSTLGGVLTDEAKQYALRKIPGYDVAKTFKRIAGKISDLKEANNASALGKPAEPEAGSIPSRTTKPVPTDPNLVDNSYIPSKAAKPTTGFKPILSDEPTALRPLGTKPTEPVSELKPIGSQPVPEAQAEPVEVRQARHRLGDVVTDALKSSADPQAPEAMQRLSKATNSQLAELSNDLGIKKPRADAVKSGADWAADDFKRTVKAHGKELAQGKELVLRNIAEKLTPSEIMDHTEYFVNPEAKPIKPMSPATERMMDALELSRESKMAARKSGVPDVQMQSLLAKLNARQLKNLGETLASGEHLPKVSGGSQGADLSPNASGESAASQEAINRTASEKAQGVKYYRLDTRSGKAVPLVGPDRVDATAGDYEEIVKVGKDGMETTLDRGNKAKPRLRSSKLLLQ